MQRLLYLFVALFVSALSSAQAFLPTDPIGTVLQYEVTKKDTVEHYYFVLKGIEKRSDSIWMEIEQKNKLKEKGVIMKLLYKPTSLSMDIGRFMIDAIEMGKDAASEISASVSGESLSIPLQYSSEKLPLETSKISMKVSRIVTVSIQMGWKEKKIVGWETLDLPSGKYETFLVRGRVHISAGVSILKKNININYIFWIAPRIGVVKYQREVSDEKNTYYLSQKTLPQR
ncbi:MAG: hypothetical protein PUK66_06465 [Bacteroidales bacterium]|uniref:TapB family protein n=1 Tax=Porphyromonas sp. TaxID=1924944 RepID=UPI002973CB1F|nr:hypothetical protein [Porphyromonas sp.]MDD7438455.1 hypothetical protein [Bacteroidales bacterium]MDY3067447.1 hypothetical protein [Porphyromonas sp.]